MAAAFRSTVSCLNGITTSVPSDRFMATLGVLMFLRGHWEGNTLVVETTNFSDKAPYKGSRENLRTRRPQRPTGPLAFTNED